MPVVAHISDMHLDGSPARLQRLLAVLDQIGDLAEVDAVLLSGDLADHGAPEEYEQLFGALPSTWPILVVPGNHDLTAGLTAALATHGYPSSLNTTVDIGGLRLVGLDSHIDFNDEGELNAGTLEYARTQLSGFDGPAVLALHHPPVPVGHNTMDLFGLTNHDDLAALVRSHSNVIGIFAGHMHTAVATTFAGVPFLGAPGIVSTMRLGSKMDPIADLDAMPGLALHTIEGSTIRTVFHYLSPSAL